MLHRLLLFIVVWTLLFTLHTSKTNAQTFNYCNPDPNNPSRCLDGGCPTGSYIQYSCQQACDAAAQGCNPNVCLTIERTNCAPISNCNSPNSCTRLSNCPSQNQVTSSTCTHPEDVCCSPVAVAPTPPMQVGCTNAVWSCNYWACAPGSGFSCGGYCCPDTANCPTTPRPTPPIHSSTVCINDNQCLIDYQSDQIFNLNCGCGLRYNGSPYCSAASLNPTNTPGPVPTSHRPRPTWQPVMANLVPCKTTPLLMKEFHPLRPYPANACDPLIPRKLPEAPTVTPDKLYLTFQCGKSADPVGTVNVGEVLVIDGIEVLPSNLDSIYLNSKGRSKDYFCKAGSYEICFVQNVVVDVALNFADSQFPILGNTQDYLSDIAKVNRYLSWYLEGTVQQSEQKRLNPDDPSDINRLINYSGPIKKLLSRQSQIDIRRSLKGGQINKDYHNYMVVPPLVRVNLASTRDTNFPFSSLEDVTGEVTVALVSGSQPVSPEIDGHIFSIGLGIGASDSRLYFPHLKETNVLSQILASTFKPNPAGIAIPPNGPIVAEPNPVDPTDNNFLSQKIASHQGKPTPPPAAINYNSVTSSLANDVQVQFTPLVNNYIVRNTEVRTGFPAPTPLYKPPSVKCSLSPVRTNPGDDLVGSTINTTVSYKQLFRYMPKRVIASPCPPASTSGMCISYGPGEACFALERDECSDTKKCCWGDCPPAEPRTCYNNYSQVGLCDYVTCTPYMCDNPTVNTMNICCSWSEIPPRYCPAWPTRDLRSMARIAVFTKTPLVDRLYDNLVSGPQSILRRFLPGQTDYSEAGPNPEFNPGRLDPKNAVPGGTSANYSVTKSNIKNSVMAFQLAYSPSPR